jgi:general secretion pathway protein J
MMAPAANRRANGFTLIEVVIALTVLGFLFVGLVQGVRFGMVAWSAEVRRTGGSDDLRTVDNTLRHVIEGMDPGDDLNHARFVATSDWLDCITALPYAFGAAPSRRMRATLRVNADRRLVLRWSPSVHARRLRPQPVVPTETELLRGVSHIELAFWRPGGNWVGSWQSADLPALVRVRLRFPPGDPRHWPDIVAAPGLDRP